jgi:hypothetical protein
MTLFSMTTTLKLLAAVAFVVLMAASHAKAGDLVVRGPSDYGYAPWKYRYPAPRFYAQQRPDLSAAIAGALAGAALQLIPRATEALMAKLPSEAAPPPVAMAQSDGSPPSNDVLDDIEGNSRGLPGRRLRQRWSIGAQATPKLRSVSN